MTITGFAKGSGMIAPDMATMLVFLFTDAAVAPGLLQEMVSRASDATFNCITVDGDTSTSDTLLMAATGRAAMAPIATAGDPRLARFEAALTDVMRDLAHQVVKDGEGATKFVEVRVTGAETPVDARRVGLAIANSPLVKTAIAGFDALWGELAGPGAPSYQGTVVDRLLPRERRWRLDVDPGGGGERALRDAVAAEVIAVGGTPPRAGDDRRAALGHGIRELRSRFGARNFVEIGIGCEACHGGSREHVADPHVHPDFAPRSPFLQARPEAGGEMTRAEQVNRVCARCHQVLFSRYPFTWEGETRRGGKPGGSSITSGEARDFLLGGCARQMSCATCHDPHAEDRRADLDRAHHDRRQRGLRPLPSAVRVRPRAGRARPPRSGRGRRELHRLPHAEEEHGARLRVDPLPPHRAAERSGARRTRSADRVRAVPRRQDRRPSWSARWRPGGGASTIAPRSANLYGTLEARPLPATLMRGKAHEQAVGGRRAGRGASHRDAAGGRASARESVPARALLRAARCRRAGAAAVPRRSRSPDGGDRGGGARLRPRGVPRLVPAEMPIKQRTRNGRRQPIDDD